MLNTTFCIFGNQDDPKGNPMGYKRTLNHSWNEEATKYFNWQEYVRGEFTQHCKDNGLQHFLSQEMNVYPLCLAKNEVAIVNCKIEFVNEVRADCDNIHKGILDSLFKNDKYVMESHYKGWMSKDKTGKVTVEIIILDKGEYQRHAVAEDNALRT